MSAWVDSEPAVHRDPADIAHEHAMLMLDIRAELREARRDNDARHELQRQHELAVRQALAAIHGETRAIARAFVVGLVAIVLAIVLTGRVSAAERSREMRAAFVRDNPCPATGQHRGACPGWQVDHVRSLCAGGIDHPTNMAWITLANHHRKTANDIAICKAQRAGVHPR